MENPSGSILLTGGHLIFLEPAALGFEETSNMLATAMCQKQLTA